MEGIQTVTTWLWDALFPIFCVECRVEGRWLCDSCRRRSSFDGVFACPICHASNMSGQCCVACQSSSLISSVVAVAPYSEHLPMGKLLHALKYDFAEDVLPTIGDIVNNFIATHSIHFSCIDAVVPIPLHPRRYAERGFNQSERIAGMVSSALRIPVIHLLHRQIYTKPQVTLGRVERLRNVKDAFMSTQHVDSSLKRVLLVDDVYTTGATMQSAAHALATSGIKEVMAFTLSRG